MEKKHFETSIEVRYRDTDSLGHIAAPVYYEYMLHTYLAFMHEILGIPVGEKIPQIMGRTSCEYIMPARYGDTIKVRSSVTRFGTKSFDIEYLMEYADGTGKPIAKGSSSHVMFDYDAHAPVTLSDSFKDAVMRFQGSL
jgi:acyl-CoA thioester hydrolase